MGVRQEDFWRQNFLDDRRYLGAGSRFGGRSAPQDMRQVKTRRFIHPENATQMVRIFVGPLGFTYRSSAGNCRLKESFRPPRGASDWRLPFIRMRTEENILRRFPLLSRKGNIKRSIVRLSSPGQPLPLIETFANGTPMFCRLKVHSWNKTVFPSYLRRGTTTILRVLTDWRL